MRVGRPRAKRDVAKMLRLRSGGMALRTIAKVVGHPYNTVRADIHLEQKRKWDSLESDKESET